MTRVAYEDDRVYKSRYAVVDHGQIIKRGANAIKWKTLVRSGGGETSKEEFLIC
jgi:hypothetical protein